jgi:hypothetical protein
MIDKRVAKPLRPGFMKVSSGHQSSENDTNNHLFRYSKNIQPCRGNEIDGRMEKKLLFITRFTVVSPV